MITENDVRFGWIPSSLEKKDRHASLYGFQIFIPFIAASVEKSIPLDPRFVSWYNQGAMNACVGASWSKAMAAINLGQVGAQEYDWRELYRWACDNDNDPKTTYQHDVGTYLWAGGDALRKAGAYVSSQGWNPDHGLESYYWCQSIDEMRTALSLDRPLEFGLPWYQGWMAPVQKSGRYWIPPRSRWGSVIGGHAIMSTDGLDSIQAFGLRNTWGPGYPDKVFFGYEDIRYLMTVGAECAVGIDRTFKPPDPPPDEKKLVLERLDLYAEGKYYLATGIEMERAR